MDFEAIWHTHKPFILKVLGGALLFLILTGARSSIASGAAQQAKKNASQQAAVQDKISQLRNAEGLEKGRAAALTDKLEPALAETLLWKTSDAYAPKAGDASPALFYDNARHQAIGAIERHAARWNAQVPKGAAGLGLREEVPADEVPEALAWADLVHRVVVKLLDAGVRNIGAVSPGEPRYVAREGDGAFLRELPLALTFQGDVSLVAKALGAFQGAGEFLEVGACRLNRGKEGLDVELTLVALSVVKEQPKNAKSGGGSGRPVRRGPQRVRQFGRER
ncbi:MAG: hypothetical protein AB7N76_07100 [Planctomycetota bacterium]